jgi:hypothetical protein
MEAVGECIRINARSARDHNRFQGRGDL